jgi:hypothetical protein
MPSNQANSSGYAYGPTANGKMYLAVFRHRGTGSRRHKHMWCVPPDTEYAIFSASDQQDLYDANQNYWGVLQNGQVAIGEQGERLSKFPYTANTQSSWHGYPVSLIVERKRNALPTDFDSLVEQWIKDAVITKEVGRKIQKERYENCHLNFSRTL